MERVKKSEEFFTDKVRDLSRKIVDTSKEILTIDSKVLEQSLVKKLQDYQNMPKDGYDPFKDESLSPENELGLNLFLDVVNFCFQDPQTQESYAFVSKSGKKIHRSSGLKSAMSESGINWGDTSEVSQISADKWAQSIQLEQNSGFYLGAERGKRIAEFAGKLNNSGFKNITDFLVFGQYDTEILLPVLSESGYFTDEFEKRSQLAVNMMDGVLKRRFNTQLKGTDKLTVMADYRLPQLMYNFNVIELSDNLLGKLMRQEIINSGSPEELALRAASVVVGEKLSKLMGIPEGEVDTLLWTMATDMGRSGGFAIPHMLVPTDKY